MSERELTGRHVLFITVASFGIIIGVNITLAVNAVATFPGLEVKNSYVASQNFDRERAAQDALGWNARAEIEEGMLRLRIEDRNGLGVVPDTLRVTLGRATHVADDMAPALSYDGTAWVAAVDVAPGRWTLRVDARAEDGTLFRQRLDIRSRPRG